MNDTDALLAVLDIANENVKTNTVIVLPNETPTPYFVHITGDKAPKYIPRIGHRQANSEDRTMPRVTVATTLTGCVIAYSALEQGFLNGEVPSVKGNYKDWKGGLYIHKLPFKVALKPNRKMVYDAEATDEHWLVNYTPEIKQYESSLLGKMVVLSILHTKSPEGKLETTYRLAISVNDVLFLNERTMVPAGCYEVVFRFNRNTTWRTKNSVTYKEISKSDFNEKKKSVMATLSVDNQKIYSRW